MSSNFPVFAVLGMVVMMASLSGVKGLYNYPPENQRDCAEMCELRIEQCYYESHCGENAACKKECHRSGSQCYNQCILTLMDKGAFRMTRG